MQQAAVHFLCGKTEIVLFQRSEHAQIALHTPRVVIADVALNHVDRRLLAGKSPAVIALTL